MNLRTTVVLLVMGLAVLAAGLVPALPDEGMPSARGPTAEIRVPA